MDRNGMVLGAILPLYDLFGTASINFSHSPRVPRNPSSQADCQLSRAEMVPLAALSV